MPSYPADSQETYSDETYLNTVEVCLPRQPSGADSDRFWIIYVHGGAWRDPEINAASFKHTKQILLSSKVAEKIAGYASINYRLSPYPSHPTDPSNPADPARNAVHPDHINDVLTAILYLQEKYKFEDRYILVGHSCGATLAMQVGMKRYWGSQYESTYALELNVVPPVAIVGLEGIYDIPALVKNHEHIPVYRDFVQNAFGPAGWDAASPSNGDFIESWSEGQLMVLAHSPEDSLVEAEQPEMMKDALTRQGWANGTTRTVQTLELHGEHDEIWKSGEAAKAIELALQSLPQP